MLEVGLDPLSVYYTPNGRPMVDHKGWVSFSHTHKYTALAWNPEVPVGVDVEAQRPQILRIAHKFSPPKVAPDQHSVEELTDLWCAKEALYKSADVPGISFLHGLEVAPWAPGMDHALGVIHTDKDLPCDVSFYRWEDQHLALAEHII
jgi:phosphopantetheinyl transferase